MPVDTQNWASQVMDDVGVTAPTAWLRVAQDICARISSGETPVGDKIPSYQQLATRHRVAIGTARRAIGQLTTAGVLEGRQGMGVFVKRLPTAADLGPGATLEERVGHLEERAEQLERRLAALEQQGEPPPN